MTIQKNLKKLFTKNKTLMLAYDQGLEHGPTDFNDKNIDPLYIIKIAQQGKFNALIFQKGIAEKYNKEIKKSRVPLIIKLNGKTSLSKNEPISSQICTIEKAISLGATAVGYTIYIGSKKEPEILKEFSKIQEQAHKKSLPVIAWIYPRGQGTKNKPKKELMAYACRVGLEIGADIIKIKYEGEKKDLKWAIKSAARTKVVIAGGPKTNEEELLRFIKEITDCGALGLAIGRNIWQSKDPIKTTQKIKKIIQKK